MTSQPKAAQDAQAQRAQLQLLEHDCKRIANPDYSRPFSSLEDAVDRLLPYHVFMDETPEAADLREAKAAEAPLAASRKEAWLAECLAKTMQFQQMVVQLHTRMDAAEERLLSHTQLPSYVLCKCAEVEEERLLTAEKQRVAAAQAAAQALKHAQELRVQQARLEAQRAQHEAALKAQAALAADGIYRPQDLPFEMKYQEGDLAEPMEGVKQEAGGAAQQAQQQQQQRQPEGAQPWGPQWGQQGVLVQALGGQGPQLHPANRPPQGLPPHPPPLQPSQRSTPSSLQRRRRPKHKQGRGGALAAQGVCTRRSRHSRQRRRA